MPRWTTTVSPSCPVSRSRSTIGDHRLHLPADLGVDDDALAASSAAAPSITESPIADDRRRAAAAASWSGRRVVGGDRRSASARPDAGASPVDGRPVGRRASAGASCRRRRCVGRRGRRRPSSSRSVTESWCLVQRLRRSRSACSSAVARLAPANTDSADERRRRASAISRRGRRVAGGLQPPPPPPDVALADRRLDEPVRQLGDHARDRHRRRRTRRPSAGCRPPAG